MGDQCNYPGLPLNLFATSVNRLAKASKLIYEPNLLASSESYVSQVSVL